MIPISWGCPRTATFLRFLCIADATPGETGMTDAEYARKLDELDRLLNDPNVPMEPAKVWSLMAEIAQRDMAATGSRPNPA
jgi:hypothetical protein